MNQLAYKQFSININTVLTLPALAMRIFKTLFMGENTIYQIHGRIENDIRKSYTGGCLYSTQ